MRNMTNQATPNKPRVSNRPLRSLTGYRKAIDSAYKRVNTAHAYAEDGAFTSAALLLTEAAALFQKASAFKHSYMTAGKAAK